MSIEVMRYVWTHSKAKSNARLMLLAIADIANDSGDAYPGVDRLAKKCNMGHRTAQDVIRDLERERELQVFENVGTRTKSGWTNLYRVVLEGVAQPEVRLPSGEVAQPRPIIDKKARSFPKDMQLAAPLQNKEVQPVAPHDMQPSAPHEVQLAAPESLVYPSEQPSDIATPSKKGKSETDKQTDAIIKGWLDGQVAPPVTNQYGNRGVRSNAKAIAMAGFTPEQVTEFVKVTAVKEYWTGKLVPIGFVANNIAAHYAAKKPAATIPAHQVIQFNEPDPDTVPMTEEARAALALLVSKVNVKDEVLYAKPA